MTSRVRSRTRTPTPPPAPPLEDVQLPHLEPLDSSSETAISSHLQKKRFLHSFSSHHSLQTNSNSFSPSKRSKPSKSKSNTSSSPSAVPELSHSDEDVEWENEARTHLPRSSSRHHHSPAGVTFTILHKGKRLVRNPEASQRLAEERQLKRLNERREKGDQRGAAGDVTMGTSEVDTVRRKGSYNSQQGVRGKLNRAGSRIVRTVGGALGGEGGGSESESESERGSEDGGSSSLRKTSTRASSINNNEPVSPQASRSTLRNLSHIVTHPFSSHSHPHSQPPSPSTSQPPTPASSPSDGLLLSPTNTIHAAGEDPNLPPSSAPLGMITSNPPQLPRLDSGMQLQPSTRTSLSSSSAAAPTPTEATPLPSPPRKPTPPGIELDAPPSPNPQPSSPSPSPSQTPTTPTPPLEPLTWGRDAPEALASAPSPIVEAIPVERWEDRREEIVKEEEEEAGLRSGVEGGTKGGKVNKGEVVWERLWENQRGIIWFGTPRYSSSSLLPTDPSAFTRPGRDKGQCRTPYDLDSYQLPDGTWSWASSWMINMRNDGQTDEKGWEYNSWFRNKGWHAVLPWHGWKGWVRRREWIRLRIHPPPPTLSSLSPPPSPTAPSPLPLPVTDASPSNGTDRERERTSSGSSSIGGLDDAVRVLASKMLDRERLEVWKGWLGRKRDRVVLKDLVEADLPTLLHTFTHPSSRQTLLDLLSSERPDWVLPLRTGTVDLLETEEEANEGKRASEGEGLVVRAGSGVGVGIDS